MDEKRENNLKTSLSSAPGGVPMVSLGTSATSSGSKLAPEVFNIGDNEFVAYYDNSHKLIFVLDNTLDVRKPNTLLVINPVDERKWDDILSNDYALDLETIRPKKDNKYQKLDIEYTGLAVYNKLINEFNSGMDTSDVISQLSDFRNASVRRAAAERLMVANDTIEKSRETISKSAESMRELQTVIKKLREKQAKQKKEFGREPPKQSAAKILKTESQIDTATEKNKRAKKRLGNARRRLAIAIADRDAAQNILGQKITVKENQGANNMDGEVKPLFNKDPEIMDDKIAFKPIEFNAPIAQTNDDLYAQMPRTETAPTPNFAPIDSNPPTPLSFTPPRTEMPVPEFSVQPTPVLDMMRPSPEPIIIPVESPVINIPEPPISPISVARPVSPLSGMPVSEISSPAPRAKTNALYYIMLIALIVLSIFTLWLYQKSTSDNIPELAAPTLPVENPAQLPDVVESPFIQTETIQPEIVPEPVFAPEPFVEPAPEYIPEPAPEPVPEQIAPAPVPVYNDEPVYNEIPVVPAEPTPRVINKPAYGAGSSSEQMFVPDDNYQPDNRQNYSDPIPENNYEEQTPGYYE